MKTDKIKNLFKENGVLSGKRVLAITVATVAIIGTTTTALAASNLTIANGKWTNKASHGRIEYTDPSSSSEVVIDSSDFDTLAVEIDACNTVVDSIINSVGITTPISEANAGEVVLKPDGTVKSSTAKPDLVDHYFQNHLASKVTVDCSGATAIADNLSEGVTAYDASGALITGTGVDNEKYYQKGIDSGYSVGFADGLAQALENVNLEYTIVHQHTSSCYSSHSVYADQCTGTSYASHDSSHREWNNTCYQTWRWTCSTHGTSGYTNTSECNECGWSSGSRGGRCYYLTCTIPEDEYIRTIKQSDIPEGKIINDLLSANEKVSEIKIVY